ncbi:MAG: hypothetical protein KDA60_15290 [Planctomycetales bacterium]|nr:hypothetical protein [Planctomycetales bacterium]
MEFNPYEAPLTEAAVLPEVVKPGECVWRDQNRIVMLRGAELPERCWKSNEEGDLVSLKRQLHWHNPWLYLLILASLLIYVVCAIVVTKRATISIWLTREWQRRRRRRIIVAWLIVLLSFIAFAAGVIDTTKRPLAEILIVGSAVGFLTGVIYGMVGARMVTATKITKTHIWLKGAHPDYVASLPEYPLEG